MKHIHNTITLSVLLIASITSLSAQSDINSSNQRFQVSIGGGITDWNLSGNTQHSTIGDFAATVEYTRFFNIHWGASVGIRLATYGTSSSFSHTLPVQNGLTDPEGDTYNLTTSYSDVSEQHNILTLAIPIMASYRFPLSPSTGIEIAAGLSLLYVPSSHYSILSGTVTNQAYYPQWNVTLQDIDGVFESGDIPHQSGDDPAIQKFGLSADADAKFYYVLSPKLQIAVGLNYSHILNNMMTAENTPALLETTQQSHQANPYSLNLTLTVAYIL